MAADAAEKAGLQVASLGRNTAAALRAQLPRAASTGNPVDVLGDADPERYVAALEAAQDDPGVDAILVLLTPQAMTRAAETARAIAGCLRHDKPVLAAFMGGRDVMPGREELVAAGLPEYPSPERAVGALRAMYEYAMWRRRPPRIVTRFRVNRRRVERIISRRLRTGPLQLGEVKAKSILAAYGFRIPGGVLATSSDEAVEAAEHIGYPVVMKVVSPDIVHKSDIGGVRVGITTRREVKDAFDLMSLRIREHAPEAHVEGFYVERMVPRGLEVILGMTRDPQFGPMLMFGLGGIFVEVMKDVAFHLAPITAEDALQMLTATRSYALLQGARGQRGVDVAAIATGLQRISQLATDFPEIAELDINPLMVGEAGTEPIAADARIMLRAPAPRTAVTDAGRRAMQHPFPFDPAWQDEVPRHDRHARRGGGPAARRQPRLRRHRLRHAGGARRGARQARPRAGGRRDHPPADDGGRARTPTARSPSASSSTASSSARTSAATSRRGSGTTRRSCSSTSRTSSTPGRSRSTRC